MLRVKEHACSLSIRDCFHASMLLLSASAYICMYIRTYVRTYVRMYIVIIIRAAKLRTYTQKYL